jgi:hypothetical protein
MKTRSIALVLLLAVALAGQPERGLTAPSAVTTGIAVAPQYSSAHVYVAPEAFDRFVASVLATFGGSKSQQAVFQITPTTSQTVWQAVTTPVGLLSVFAFKTPIPYPFGLERTGYLVTDMDVAVRSAREHGADLQVAVFPDPIGRDVIIQWPGGVTMQLYWHTTPPKSPPLTSIPENRVYVSPDRADAFIRDFVAFAHGKIASNEAQAPGIEIGRPADNYRRVRIDSNFGKITVLVTDGHLPYPYGREIMGYEVADLADTLRKAEAAGVRVLVQPYSADSRSAALVEFPGGYIAEIHSISPH